MSNDQIDECKVYNLGFMAISPEHIGCLIKAGFNINENTAVTNQLPMIGEGEGSSTVQFIVRETIKCIEVNTTNIYIVSGVPDVCHYVITELLSWIEEGKIPIILMPLGRYISGKFRVSGFRQVIVPGVDEPRMIRMAFNYHSR